MSTVDGMIYPTLSDADQVESKIIAVFNRKILQYRDFVDLFLFSSKLTPQSRERLTEKFRSIGVTGHDIGKRLEWQRFPDEQKERYGKVLFRVAELANVAGQNPHALNVELSRLPVKGVIERYATGVYGHASGVEPEDLITSVVCAN